MEMKYFPASKIGVLIRPEDRNPRNMIVFGITGSAKSTILEGYAEKEYENGTKIVDVWDSKDDMEGGYRLFPPSNKQKDIMGRLFEGMKKYEGKVYPTDIYHPLCKDVPRKLPSCFKLFTIPLNSMSLDDISFLAENTKPTVSTRVLYNILKRLDRRTTLVDLFAKVGELSQKTDVSIYFGQRIRMRTGTMKSYALKIFIEFNEEYTISSQSNCLALTEERLIKELNDNKKFTVFSMKWVTDEKSKYFITLWLMNQIARLKTEGKIEPKVVLVLRDLHTLAPRYFNFDEQFKFVMINKIYYILSTFRSKDIEIISDNQDPTTLNTRLTGQFPEILVGPIFTPNEVQYFAESGSFMDKNILQAIASLRTHGIKKFYDVNSGEFIIPLYPRHRHKEPGEDFFKLWKLNYGKYKDWTYLIANSKNEMFLSEKKLTYEQKEMIQEEKTKDKIKIEEGLPEEVKKLAEFSRVDIERILNLKTETAGRRIRDWKKMGFIEQIGESTSKNVKYKPLLSSYEENQLSIRKSSSS